jgi:hypothetical protein
VSRCRFRTGGETAWHRVCSAPPSSPTNTAGVGGNGCSPVRENRRRTTVATSLAALPDRAFHSEFDQTGSAISSGRASRGSSWWTSFTIAPTEAAIGVPSVVPGPAARILSPSPIATNGTTCATRREAGVTGFDCGAGGVLLPRYPRQVVASSVDARSGPSGTPEVTQPHNLTAPATPPLGSPRSTRTRRPELRF